MTLKTWLQDNGFELRYEIALDAARLKPIAAAGSGAERQRKPCVYLWLDDKPDVDESTVLYVGKAGKGIAKRLVEHANGFITAKAGNRRKAAIEAYFAARPGRRIRVYVRDSDVYTLFGRTVTLNAAEEHALFERFEPEWNFAAFPSVEEPADESTAAPMLDVSDVPGPHDAESYEASLAPAERVRFSRLIAILRELGILKLDCRLIDGYAGQPAGCNDVQTLTFGRYANHRFAPGSWCARIPLSPAVTVVFPAATLQPGADRDAVSSSADGKSWCPRNLDRFLGAPHDFIDADALRRRIHD
jgi:hypothetical protein